MPGGRIVMACSGNSVATESSSLLDPNDSGYSIKDVSTSAKVDVTFTKGDTSNRYVYVCINGQAVQDVSERP